MESTPLSPIRGGALKFSYLLKTPSLLIGLLSLATGCAQDSIVTKQIAKADQLFTNAVVLTMDQVQPGFVDAHDQLVAGEWFSQGVSLYSAQSKAEVLATVSEYAKANPQSPAITGAGWSAEILGGFPKAADLDSNVPDYPGVPPEMIAPLFQIQAAVTLMDPANPNQYPSRRPALHSTSIRLCAPTQLMQPG